MLKKSNIFVDKDAIANYIMGMKDANANNTMNLRVAINEAEKREAKKIAKSKGYSFQGWLGHVVKNELAKHNQNTDIHKTV